MRLSSGRCAPCLVFPDEAGARRPIFCSAADPAHTHIGLERILYSNLIETAGRHFHLHSIAASGVYLQRQAGV
jgi:hypothetical protein